MSLEEFNEYLRTHKVYFAFKTRYRIKSATGFDINDGWYQALKDCFEEMFQAGWDGELAQVKEKWGGLQIYLISYYPELEEIIKKYTQLSYTICERCGTTDNVKCDNTCGWFLTLCPDCQQKIKDVHSQRIEQLLGENSQASETDSTS